MSTDPLMTEQVPIFTVTHLKILKEGIHPLTNSTTLTNTTLLTEQACGWAPCRYFYLGQLHPQFGEFAFAYAPSVETQGHAGPFDSGGLWKGFMAPFKPRTSEQDPQVIELLKRTSTPLQRWRTTALKRYMGAAYSQDSLARYLDRQRPDTDLTSWDEHLPANYLENTDWRAWTWEVRLQRALPLTEGLIAWACSIEAFDELVRWILRQTTPSEALTELQSLIDRFEPITDERSSRAFEALRRQTCL